MKNQFLALLLLSLSANSVHGAVVAWGQCGGVTYSGDTACVSGYACAKVNDYYYQCQPGTVSTAASTTALTPTTATTTPSTTTTTTAASTASAAGQLIRGVSTPIYHLYLQSLAGVPVMAAEATALRFIISGSIQDTTSGLYLNADSSTTSYKPISFGATATTTGWGLEGDTIITTNASVFGRQLNFLACETSTSGAYKLYLQTGSDTPSGETCTLQTLHLPCLC
ncbi:hypothetical protein DFP73DRAFT_337725 [Morchella snyderi]|nr:hypothetical protein DFP73DRAFT_337725 [Morchella snyderi]